MATDVTHKYYMNKFLKHIVFLSFLLTGSANAQMEIGTVNVPFKCFDTKSVFTFLNDEFKEQPITTLKSVEKEVIFSLWVNKKENTWTLLTTRQNITCIIALGNEFLIFGPIQYKDVN